VRTAVPKIAGNFPWDTIGREKLPQPRASFGVSEETPQFNEFSHSLTIGGRASNTSSSNAALDSTKVISKRNLRINK
jgi:hypothetical protein